jgi:hypothetical protein
MIAPLLAGHDTAEASGALEDVELATELVTGMLGVVDDTGDETGDELGVVDDTGMGLGVVDDTGVGLGVVDDTRGGLEDGLPETRLAPQTFVLLLGLPKPFLR